MYKSFACAAIAALFLISTAASAQQATYGVEGFYGGQALYGYGYPGGQLVDYPSGNHDTTYTGSIPFSASASGSAGSASGSVAISATPESGNVGLHAFATASFAGTPPGESAGASADFDLYAYDTFHIGGESGAAEQFRYTLNLDAAIAGGPSTSSSDYAYGYYQLLADSSWTSFGTVSPFVNCTAYGGFGNSFEANGNPCSIIAQMDVNSFAPADQSLTGIITLMGASTIRLGQFLDARVGAGGINTSGSATFDASNTGWLTLTPLTAGASFTTDSGLTYANSPDLRGAVPEPATWAMMLLGFGAIGAIARRRRRSRSVPTQLA